MYLLRPRWNRVRKVTRSHSTASRINLIDDKDLREGEMKEVPFPGTRKKILLSRVGGQVFATQSRCPHAGVALCKGILTKDARVICPYHVASYGAQFNLFDGCATQGPVTKGLVTYPVKVRNGKIEMSTAAMDLAVKANSEFATGGRHSSDLFEHVVIVGAGAVAESVVATLIENAFRGRISVIGQEPYLPYDRTKCSKSISLAPKLHSSALLRSHEFYDGANVDLYLDCQVSKISVKDKKLTMRGASVPSLSYSTLVLCPGARPRRLSVGGHHLHNIFTIRNITDANAVRNAAESAKDIVIVGMSFIGTEAAAALRRLNKQANITLVGAEQAPLAGSFGEEIGQALEPLFSEERITTIASTSVQEYIASPDHPTKIGTVRLSDGSVIAADIVVEGVGVECDTEFLKQSSEIPLSSDGSIQVNSMLQVTPDVYAAGDAASVFCSESRQFQRTEHWNVAVGHGRTIARNIVENATVAYQEVPFFWTTQFGKTLRLVGSTNFYDRVVIDGDLSSFKFAAYFLHNDRVRGVATMNRDPEVAAAKILFEQNAMSFSAADVQSSSFSLIEALHSLDGRA